MDSITKQLTEIVQPLYLVGGSVRDRFLGRETFDLDYATPLLPDEIQKIIRSVGIKPNLVGKRFGTIRFKINEYDVQITTFRGERYTRDTRKPKVEFVNELIDDLKRRDFTVNSIALDGDKIFDPYNGASDISNKIIRSVGSPKDRMSEDPLRMLRAYRFSSELGFTIESRTQRAIESEGLKILLVSKERIAQELDKLVLGDHYADVINVFMESAIFKYLLPELYAMSNSNKKNGMIENSLFSGAGDNKLANRWARTINILISRSSLDNDPYFKSELLAHIANYYRWSNERTKITQKCIMSS